jgi:hypothetical protein
MKLGINPLVKRREINPALRSLVLPIMMSKASFVSIGLIPTGIDKCNTKIMIDIIRYPDLFRVEN